MPTMYHDKHGKLVIGDVYDQVNAENTARTRAANRHRTALGPDWRLVRSVNVTEERRSSMTVWSATDATQRAEIEVEYERMDGTIDRCISVYLPEVGWRSTPAP